LLASRILISLASITCMTYTYCCVYSAVLLMMDRETVWNVEFYSKNEFEKLLHLVGLIIRIRVDSIFFCDPSWSWKVAVANMSSSMSWLFFCDVWCCVISYKDRSTLLPKSKILHSTPLYGSYSTLHPQIQKLRMKNPVTHGLEWRTQWHMVVPQLIGYVTHCFCENLRTCFIMRSEVGLTYQQHISL
jgi:hypothetical protein